MRIKVIQLFLLILLVHFVSEDYEFNGESPLYPDYEFFCVGEPEIRNGYRIYKQSNVSDETRGVQKYEYYKTQNSEVCKRRPIIYSLSEK